jgi:predicted GIY-YIG superfamily endonuclease
MAKGNDGERWHFVYRTTNKINGKYYIGVHSTWKLDDGYLGSGSRLRNAIKKHGIENFTLEVIQFFDIREDALAKEKELVTTNTLSDPNCMNLRTGGDGGWGPCHKARRDWLRQNDPKWKKRYAEICSRINKERLANNPNDPWFFDWSGKKHKPETIEKMKQHDRSGSKNSQFGKVWIHRLEPFESIRINRDEIDGYLSEGWSIGRKLTK